MYESFELARAAWHQLAEIALFLGVSVGTVLGCALAVWFVPPFRKLAAIIGIIALTAAISGGYTFHVGKAFVQAQWDKADAYAATKRQERDDALARALEAKYAPIIAANQKQAQTYERDLMAAKSAAASNPSCQLGGDALRLRGRGRK